MTVDTTGAATTEVVDVAAIQKALAEQNLDGWLFYFFHGNDPLAPRILKLSYDHFCSRRWFYFIPRTGSPKKLVHRIEMDALDRLPGERVVYLGWRELEQNLALMLAGTNTVAMQYSPRDAVPYISRVDAGTVELVQSCGPKVVSSGDLVQLFEARWSPAQLATHLEAVEALRKIVFEAFGEIRRCINNQESVNEYQIQQFIVSGYARYGMTSNSPPIVAVNSHSGSPHYQPTRTSYSEIRKGDFVLFDIWAKKQSPADAIYGDITWTGYVGTEVPDKYKEIFDIVAGARDAGLAFVKDAVASGKTIRGAEVDDVSRRFITERGYGPQFVHRTGHSIGTEVHANGANIDNLETRDERRLIPRTGFSIEPGVYLEEFGVRSEIDVYVGESEVKVGGEPIQTEVIPILRNN
jgi:Xaa-Pro aminopeptidase